MTLNTLTFTVRTYSTTISRKCCSYVFTPRNFMRRGIETRAGVHRLESRQIVLRNLPIEIRFLRGDRMTRDSNERRMGRISASGDRLWPFHVSTKLKHTLSENVRHRTFKSKAARRVWRSGDLCGRRGRRRPRAARVARVRVVRSGTARARACARVRVCVAVCVCV